jgi:hypothetical protein
MRLSTFYVQTCWKVSESAVGWGWCNYTGQAGIEREVNEEQDRDVRR